MTDRTGLADILQVTPMANVPFWRQTILLYGIPKIGKTTEASKLPHAIFFDAEQGTIGIDVLTFENLLPNRDRINSPIGVWEDVLAATAQLETAKGKNIDGVVVIDTGQASFDMCREYVLRTNGWSHETEGAYGKGWRAVKDEYAGWINRIKAIGFGIVFIAHQTVDKIEEPARTYEKVRPRMDKGPMEIIEPFVNLILYADRISVQGQECAVVHTKPSLKITAGERGIKPRLQPMLPFDMDAIQRNWNGEYIDLNVWFGFAEPPSTNGVGAAQPHNQTPPVNHVDQGVAAVAQQFDAVPAS